MSKFTPGPWKMKTRHFWDDVTFEINVPYYEYWICLVGARNTNSKPYEKEIEANARLISKAPEMYKWLKAYTRIMPDVEIIKLLKEIDGV